ncbi:hypothetical protein TYRP_006597 [Tyrophagus putrescentiae]|nr:hypothetical protein TYRP_006597 [Tyrophagus putrescentiae]
MYATATTRALVSLTLLEFAEAMPKCALAFPDKSDKAPQCSKSSNNSVNTPPVAVHCADNTAVRAGTV